MTCKFTEYVLPEITFNELLYIWGERVLKKKRGGELIKKEPVKKVDKFFFGFNFFFSFCRVSSSLTQTSLSINNILFDIFHNLFKLIYFTQQLSLTTPVINSCILPWTQNVNYTYISRSEDAIGVFWTSCVRSIYVLCPGGLYTFLSVNWKLFQLPFFFSCTNNSLRQVDKKIFSWPM